MRYQVIVEIKATRVVTLDADSGPEALRKAERTAYPGLHARDKVRSTIVSGYPKTSASRTPKRVSIRVP
jgi:hypothetical protein